MRGPLPWLLALAVLVLGQVPVAIAAPAAAEPAPAELSARHRGAIVVGLAARCRPAAKALARGLYADAVLRPSIDEATARALMGERADREPPPSGEPASPEESQDEPSAAPAPERGDALVGLVEAIAAACGPRCGDSDVARRLISSLGRDLEAQLVVTVQCADPADQATAPATAHVLRVVDGQFAPVMLTAQASADAADAPRWPDAVRVLRALSAPEVTAVEPPKPVAPSARPTRKPSPADAALRPTAADGDQAEQEEDSGWDFLSSPWFWGGLGVLVAAGVTVFALSQSSLDDPDTVHLEGRIAP